jgi:magnesium chelatase family protein
VPLARTYSVALIGVTGHVVEIEADIANGLPAVIVVGLPDTALREARDRIRAAITNSREEWPQRKITVGLSPASLPKRGSWFDLAIAIGILAAAGKVPRAAAAGVMFFGELGLDEEVGDVLAVLDAAGSERHQNVGQLLGARAGFRRNGLFLRAQRRWRRHDPDAAQKRPRHARRQSRVQQKAAPMVHAVEGHSRRARWLCHGLGAGDKFSESAQL